MLQCIASRFDLLAKIMKFKGIGLVHQPALMQKKITHRGGEPVHDPGLDGTTSQGRE
jgi:hypothetical protein